MKETSSRRCTLSPALPLALLAITLTSVPVRNATAQSTWTKISGTKTFSAITAGSASKIGGTSLGYALIYVASNNYWVTPLANGAPMAMSQTSIELDNGWMWGVRAGNGDPCRTMTNVANGAAQGCYSTGGSLKQISAGNQNEIWGVNSANTAFRFNNTNYMSLWEQRGTVGAISNVSAASDGTVWGIAPTQAIVRWNGSGWTTMPGAAVQVSVGSGSQVWVVNAAGNVYQWTGTSWTYRPDAGICTMVAAAADGTVLVIRKADSFVYKKS